MFSRGDSELNRASANDSKTIIDGLSKTLKLGEQLRNDRLRCEERKRRALNEVMSRVKESAAEQQKLQAAIVRLNSEVKNSKLRIQRHQYEFDKSLATLVNLIRTLDSSNASAQRLKLVKELQTFYL